MLGNARKISVNTFETGCEYTLFSGFNNEDTLGYGGPTRFCFGTPCAASCCRLCRKSNKMTSRGHVGATLRIGVEWVGEGWSATEVFNGGV